MSTKSIAILSAVIILIVGIFFWQAGPGGVASEPLEAQATVYMGRACGCCEVYADYLSRQGVETEVVTLSDEDLLTLKEEKNIPPKLYSCHTSIFGDYVVEGHIPTGVIAHLLETKPELAGIALPGMPAGTPGMPGPKLTDWSIKAISFDGSVSEFMIW